MLILLIATIVMAGLAVFYGLKLYKISQKQLQQRNEDVKELMFQVNDHFHNREYNSAQTAVSKALEIAEGGVLEDVYNELNSLKDKVNDALIATQVRSLIVDEVNNELKEETK